ncbi:TolC family protein [Luteolibacter algae]|uniref:TolC family protein n=1 Tax=Luteolibacter algae TaxID=454151 RepID=A0ABW5D643_9BACT
MKLSIFTTLICLSASGLLQAEPVEILSFESIPGRIRHSNPTLSAARFRINEALGKLKQSGRLSNPSLETGLDHNVRSAEGRVEIGISQKFPLTNRLALEKEISLAEVDAAEAEVRNVERLLIAQAREEFIKALSIRERMKLLEKQRSLASELASFISDASERGEISTLDAAQARLAALRLTTEERRLEAEEIAVLGILRPLVGIDATAKIKLSGSPPPIALPANAVQKRPDLAAARHGLIAAGNEIALEQAKRRDDLEATIFAAGERTEDAPDGLENEGIIGFKLSIPLPFWNDNQGNIDAATARRDRKAQELNALLRDIHHEAQSQLAMMKQWQTLIDELDDQLLPMAEEQTSLLEEAYRQGQGDLQSVLASREQILELLASRLDATREFQLARIRYQTALGKP